MQRNPTVSMKFLYIRDLSPLTVVSDSLSLITPYARACADGVASSNTSEPGYTVGGGGMTSS